MAESRQVGDSDPGALVMDVPTRRLIAAGLVPALLGALLLPRYGGLSVDAAAWALVVAVGAIAATAWLAVVLRGLRETLQARTQQLDHERRNNATLSEYVASVADAGGEILPRWSSHIGLAAGQVETGITELAQQFSVILNQIQGALANSREVQQGGGEDAGLVEVITASRADLDTLLREMKSGLDAKQPLLDQIKELSSVIDELRKMAAEVAAIAAQTNLLALNAAIEAARAGDAGRGFSVVADEVRKLSTASGDTGRQIGAKIESITQSIQATAQAAVSLENQDRALIDASQQKIARVVERFDTSASAMQDAAQGLATSSEEVRQQIEKVLVSLQFQDRVSQILAHSQCDIEKLSSALAASANAVPQVLDIGQWIAEMERKYVTLEQKSLAAEGRPTASEIQFF